MTPVRSKRVAIVTFHRALSYGAALQVYALKKQVEAHGYVCDVLDANQIGYRLSRNIPISGLRSFLRSVVRGSLLELLLSKRADTRRVLRFRMFAEEHGIYSGQPPQIDHQDLRLIQAKYDAFITGSDQVWNPEIIGEDFSFFLDFVTDDKKKIAYAASFGLADPPPAYLQRVSGLIGAIPHLSVREMQATRIVERIVGRRAHVVLDPTLLLTTEHWNNVAHSKSHHGHQRPYILSFSLGRPPRMQELCRHLRNITGFRVVHLGYGNLGHRPWGRVIRDAGPREFLDLVANAAIVVTNSFHATTFALIYEKPFFITPTAGASALARNSRITSILDVLNIHDRVLEAGASLPTESDIDIFYEPIKARLNTERERSLNLLRSFLSESST